MEKITLSQSEGIFIRGYILRFLDVCPCLMYFHPSMISAAIIFVAITTKSFLIFYRHIHPCRGFRNFLELRCISRQ